MRVGHCHEHGGPEVRIEEVHLPRPAPGQVRLRTEADRARFATRRPSEKCPAGNGGLPDSPHGEVVGVVDLVRARLVRMTTPRVATTLIVIDVQESALRDCPNVNEVIANINQLVGRGRDAGCPVIFVQHDDPSDPDMVAGSAGWQLSPDLDRTDADMVMPKTYRDAFAATGLDDALSLAGAQRLVLMGVHSDFCVMTTALSAVQHGYDVTLVSDAHTAQTADLRSGSIEGRLLVDLVNARIATLRAPGRVIELLPAARVEI